VEGGGVAPGEAGVGEGGMSADGGVVRGCGSGEICIEGRCHEQCTSDAQCGPREQCGADGACVRRAGPEPDSGMMRMDAGPGALCDTVRCADPQVCHTLSGECVECNQESLAGAPGSPGRCSGLRPICDIANGRCVEAGPAQCAPCNVDAECDPGDMSFLGRCVLRDIMDWREQACMRSCDSETPCPAGLVCNVDVCEPPAGSSCTTWQAATSRRACVSDSECNIADSGGSSSFFTQTCEGEVLPTDPDGGDGDGGLGDGGPPTPGSCVQPCAVTEDCFEAASGQMCSDTGTGLTFCVP